MLAWSHTFLPCDRRFFSSGDLHRVFGIERLCQQFGGKRVRVRLFAQWPPAVAEIRTQARKAAVGGLAPINRRGFLTRPNASDSPEPSKVQPYCGADNGSRVRLNVGSDDGQHLRACQPEDQQQRVRQNLAHAGRDPDRYMIIRRV